MIGTYVYLVVAVLPSCKGERITPLFVSCLIERFKLLPMDDWFAGRPGHREAQASTVARPLTPFPQNLRTHRKIPNNTAWITVNGKCADRITDIEMTCFASSLSLLAAYAGRPRVSTTLQVLLDIYRIINRLYITCTPVRCRRSTANPTGTSSQLQNTTQVPQDSSLLPPPVAYLARPPS